MRARCVDGQIVEDVRMLPVSYEFPQEMTGRRKTAFGKDCRANLAERGAAKTLGPVNHDDAA